MLSLFGLKSHLKEVLPSVICFYYKNSIDIQAFLDRTTFGVNINIAKLYEYQYYTKINLDKIPG